MVCRYMRNESVILLRSSWQTANIGDIAHTPGVLRVLQKKLPQAHIILWPRILGEEERRMLLNNFPSLEIVDGKVNDQGLPDNQALQNAWDRADFLLHGSGPTFVSQVEAESWVRHTGKRFGVFGITLDQPTQEQVKTLDKAAFLLTRETLSIEQYRQAGGICPVVEFGPDGTYSCDLRDDAKAESFMEQNGLEPGSFFCAIPRLRYTPYYKIYPREPNDTDLYKEEVSNRYAEQDHAKLRGAIVRLVRETGLKAVICPEMTYQLDIIDELLFDPLPEDVKSMVVPRRTYWLPDEASSLYRHARTVASFECHSPILGLVQRTPVVYLRQPTDTIKGQMWRDIGLSRWILEIDEVEDRDIYQMLLTQIQNTEESQSLIQQTLAGVDTFFENGVQKIRAALLAASRPVG